MYIEIRDRLTMIPALVVELEDNPATRRLGFFMGGDTGPHLLLCRLSDGESHINPYDWTGGTRTMRTAHTELLENWRKQKRADGAVVDVEFLLGETTEPKKPELRGWQQHDNMDPNASGFGDIW